MIAITHYYYKNVLQLSLMQVYNANILKPIAMLYNPMSLGMQYHYVNTIVIHNNRIYLIAILMQPLKLPLPLIFTLSLCIISGSDMYTLCMQLKDIQLGFDTSCLSQYKSDKPESKALFWWLLAAMTTLLLKQSWR